MKERGKKWKQHNRTITGTWIQINKTEKKRIE